MKVERDKYLPDYKKGQDNHIVSSALVWAEIAESLAKDMQDEKLYGRTLTLKLKTAGFEVRTRAVSLQKYICSKDEILNYALKLLKTELPLSLRLIGLRMSQFRGDSHGPLDPMQKTLNSFIISSEEINDNTNVADSLSIERSGMIDQVPKFPLGGNSIFSNEDDCIDVPFKSDVSIESHSMDGASQTTIACIDTCLNLVMVIKEVVWQ